MLKIFFYCLLICFVFLTNISNIRAQEGWRGIIPLVSTRDEVEKKIGKPNENGFYEFDEGRVFITYVEVNCDKIIRCDCLVPFGTVQHIRISIYYDLSVEDLGLNSKKYKKTRNTHTPDVYTYSNHKTGIVYSVQDGMVDSISYYETEKTCQVLEKGKQK